MIKNILKSVLSPRFRNTLTESWIYRYSVLFFNYQRVLKPRLTRNFSIRNAGEVAVSVKKQRILVPLIETSHYNFYQILIVAKALQLRGHEVRLLLCGSALNGCEVKSVRNLLTDPCLNCRFNKNNVVPYFNLDTVVLNDYISNDDEIDITSRAEEIVISYPKEALFNGIDIIRITNDSVTRYYYGNVPENDSRDLREVRQRFLISAMKGLLVASKIHKSWNPTLIFSHLNVYADWEPYFKYFERVGAELSTMSISPFNYHAQLLNYADLFSSCDRFSKWLESRSSKPLTGSETVELSNLLNNRFQGNATVFKQYSFFDKNSVISNFLTIDSTKHNIFLFSNVFWDVGIAHENALYSDVISWVLDTIEIVSLDANTHLYIKPHPAEKYDSGATSAKGVIDYIFERFKELPRNVTIIYPEFKINTYELFPYIKLGIIYNGTLGIEMMVNGVPVVSTGKGPYSGTNLVCEPKNREAYINTILSREIFTLPDQSYVQLFAYFYFIKTLIPWKLTKRAYADQFDGFTIDSLDDLFIGNDPYLDHLCNSIVDKQNVVIENWN